MATAALLGACGGGGSPSVTPGETSPKALTLTPASLTYYSSNSKQQTSVSVSGAIGPVTVRVGDPTMAAISAASSTSFVVTPIAGGTTTITATDSSGATGTATVNTFMCVPPEPAFQVVYPRGNATNVPTSASIWVAVIADGDPVNGEIPNFYPRLIANDGSAVTGTAFTITSNSPPAGSAMLPSGYVWTYATATMSALAAGKSYRLQIADPQYQCLPPLVLGSFST